MNLGAKIVRRNDCISIRRRLAGFIPDALSIRASGLVTGPRRCRLGARVRDVADGVTS